MTDKPETSDHKNSSVAIVVAFIIIGLLAWLAYNTFIKTDYSKTWWSGTRQVRLCKIPYYQNSSCYTSEAVSVDGRITEVVANDKRFFVTDTACYEASSAEDFKQFCKFTLDGQRWDVLPQ